MILAGDIGGTKTLFAIYDNDTELNNPILQKSYRSQKYQNFTELLSEFLETNTIKFDRFCFGVAGPVINGEANISNLGWRIFENELSQLFKTSNVKLLNDLEAMSYGVVKMQNHDLEIVNPGNPVPYGNIAIIAAGTGLGEGFLIWNGLHYRAIASEGGHVDFAPQDSVEVELLQYLKKQYQHVSYERVLSGMGLTNIYQFLKWYRNYQEPPELKARLESEDPNVVISELGLAGKNPICEETLNRFMIIYGAEAGNLAIKIMATNAVYIGGGIAPKILPKFKENFFIDSFLNKGRLQSVLKDIPVKVILNPYTALIGAAHYAQIYLS